MFLILSPDLILAGYYLLLCAITAVCTYVFLYLISDQFDEFKHWIRVISVPTQTSDSVAVGQVNLEGTVSPVADSIVSPFTQTECVYICWEIEDYQGNNSWETLKTGDHTDKLLLEDDTGKICIGDPSDPVDNREPNEKLTPSIQHKGQQGDGIDDRTEYTISYVAEDKTGEACRTEIFISSERTNMTTVSAGESPPEAIRDYCADTGIKPVVDDRRRYSEYTIPDEHLCYVQGEAKRVESGDADPDCTELHLTNDGDSGQFLLADRTEAEFVQLLLWKWKISLLASIIVFVLILFLSVLLLNWSYPVIL